jgi:hypothetical protein
MTNRPLARPSIFSAEDAIKLIEEKEGGKLSPEARAHVTAQFDKTLSTPWWFHLANELISWLKWKARGSPNVVKSGPLKPK